MKTMYYTPPPPPPRRRRRPPQFSPREETLDSRSGGETTWPLHGQMEDVCYSRRRSTRMALYRTHPMALMLKYFEARTAEKDQNTDCHFVFIARSSSPACFISSHEWVRAEEGGRKEGKMRLEGRRRRKKSRQWLEIEFYEKRKPSFQQYRCKVW